MISVIIPFYNEAEYLEHTIRALHQQAFPRDRYELIFVDSHSTDGSADIVRRYPDIRLLNEEKKNIYAALNRGIRQSRGDVLAFAGADCVPGPGWLAAISRAMEEGSSLVMGRCCFPGGGLLKAFEDYENSKAEYVLSRCPREFYYGYTNNLAAQRTLFDDMGLFAETPVTGDTEFVQRVIFRSPSLKMVYLPDMTVTHREVENSWIWLRKMLIYGRYNRDLAGDRDYRGLDFKTRWKIFGHASRRYAYSPVRFLLSLMMLALGAVYYRAGEVCAAVFPPNFSKQEGSS